MNMRVRYIAYVLWYISIKSTFVLYYTRLMRILLLILSEDFIYLVAGDVWAQILFILMNYVYSLNISAVVNHLRNLFLKIHSEKVCLS